MIRRMSTTCAQGTAPDVVTGQRSSTSPGHERVPPGPSSERGSTRWKNWPSPHHLVGHVRYAVAISRPCECWRAPRIRKEEQTGNWTAWTERSEQKARLTPQGQAHALSFVHRAWRPIATPVMGHACCKTALTTPPSACLQGLDAAASYRTPARRVPAACPRLPSARWLTACERG